MEDNTPEDVCRAVALDLRARRLTHEEVGKRIGKSRTAISNLISRKRLFSRYYADLFAKTFGYNRDFLLYGKGTLMSNGKVNEIKFRPSEWSPDSQILITLIDIAGEFIRLSGNRNLTQAWLSFTGGQYDMFQHFLELTQKETGETFRMPADSISRLMCDKAHETIHPTPLHLNKE